MDAAVGFLQFLLILCVVVLVLWLFSVFLFKHPLRKEKAETDIEIKLLILEEKLLDKVALGKGFDLDRAIICKEITQRDKFRKKLYDEMYDEMFGKNKK